MLLEEVADDRSYATWTGLVDTRLEALGARVRSLVGDLRQAVTPRSELSGRLLSLGADVQSRPHKAVGARSRP